MFNVAFLTKTGVPLSSYRCASIISSTLTNVHSYVLLDDDGQEIVSVYGDVICVKEKITE